MSAEREEDVNSIPDRKVISEDAKTPSNDLKTTSNTTAAEVSAYPSVQEKVQTGATTSPDSTEKKADNAPATDAKGGTPTKDEPTDSTEKKADNAPATDAKGGTPTKDEPTDSTEKKADNAPATDVKGGTPTKDEPTDSTEKKADNAPATDVKGGTPTKDEPTDSTEKKADNAPATDAKGGTPTKDEPTDSTEKKADNAPATDAKGGTPTKDEPTEEVPSVVSITLSFIDPIGKGVADLRYRVILSGKVTEGQTDTEGKAASIENVKPFTELDIQVKRDDGSWASKYKGETLCADMHVCLKSPYLKLVVTTEEHSGAPQKASPPKPAPPKPETPKPPLPLAGEIKGGGKPQEVKGRVGRNEEGQPTVQFNGALDWAARVLTPTWRAVEHLYDDFKNWRKGQDSAAGSGNANAASTPAAEGIAPAKSVITSLDQPAPLAVTQLIAIMEEQTSWQWREMFVVQKLGTGTILDGLKNKTLVPPTGKAPSQSDGRCYPSVKTGLMRANLARNIWNDIPAKGAGPWLKSQDYVDVKAFVPDGRWAAPGDIIVYRYDDVTEEKNNDQHKADFERYEAEKKAYPDKLKQWDAAVKAWEEKCEKIKEAAEASKKAGKTAAQPKLPNKPVKPMEPKAPDAENWGHIDVRTYDGYISDFKTKVLPRAVNVGASKGFLVTGIYRKIYDPLPDIRVRAFLKILREWENHGIPDDEKRYYSLYKTGKVQEYFSDTSKHPFEGVNAERTPSGAYQFTLETYMDYIKPARGIGPGFSPAQQDRLAVARIEGTLKKGESYKAGDILGLIRRGAISEALTALNAVWSSLPGGVGARKNVKTGAAYTLDEVVLRHREIMNELIGK